MKYHITLLSMLMLVSSSFAMAQEDDMYFTPRRAKKDAEPRKVEIIYEEETPEQSDEYILDIPEVRARMPLGERDIDEYNRRGRDTVSSTPSDTVYIEAEPGADTRALTTYQLSGQSLYDLGYSEGYTQGYDDAEDMDYYYGLRLARFHGRHFYDPWYWSCVSYVHNPWHWDPWYYDPWYRPYYYGGWCSVGWGIGHWGSYWGHHHHHWHGWHAPHYHHPPHHWGAHHGPRHSYTRNRDYGRVRIMSRNTRMGDGRPVSPTRSDRGTPAARPGSSRGDRIAHRNADRHDRASERRTYRRAGRGTRGDDGGTSRAERPTDRTRRPGNAERPTDRTRRRQSDVGTPTNRSTPRSTPSVRGGSRGGGSRGGGSRGGGRGR